MIPIPGWMERLWPTISPDEQIQAGRRVLGMYSMFTGGALERCAVGALGIMPYISATIILQLLTAVVPRLSKLAREEGGRAKIIQYGRYLTVLLCLGQGLFMAVGWEHAQNLFPSFTGDLLTESSAMRLVVSHPNGDHPDHRDAFADVVG
jgi:preprotein translocase subunit SecY